MFLSWLQVARDGSVRLVSPRELRRSEVHAIVLGIKRKFHELRLGPATQVQGYVRFVNRLKRALNYSPQKGNRDPSFLWARAAEVILHKLLVRKYTVASIF